MSTETLLSVQNITKNYGNLTVLRNVSLDVSRGSFVAIMGASGAGKSTLLHIMGTLDTPDSGTVMIGGAQPFAFDKKQIAKFRNEKMGFVFQFHHLLPEFTALENICMPLWIGGKSRKEAMERSEFLLEKVGMMHRRDHKPSQMSGGEQQRIAIARALAMNPSIVFADEPTGNLDTENAEAIHSLFLQLRNEFGLTIVVVTHNTDLAKIADRVLVMKDGEIISDVMNAQTQASMSEL